MPLKRRQKLRICVAPYYKANNLNLNKVAFASVRMQVPQTVRAFQAVGQHKGFVVQ